MRATFSLQQSTTLCLFSETHSLCKTCSFRKLQDPLEALVATIAGHEGGVACLTFIPRPWCLVLTAGTYSATVEFSSDLRLYDYDGQGKRPTGVLKPRPRGLEGHRGQVHSLLAVPVAAQVVTADNCGSVLVWALLGTGANTQLSLVQRLDAHALSDPSTPLNQALAEQALLRGEPLSEGADGSQEASAKAATAAAAANPLALGPSSHKTVRGATIRPLHLSPIPGRCLLIAGIQQAPPPQPATAAATTAVPPPPPSRAEDGIGASTAGAENAVTKAASSSSPPTGTPLKCVEGQERGRITRAFFVACVSISLSLYEFFPF